MRRSLRLLMALTAAAIVGCTVGPDYERPELDMPETWRFDYAEAAAAINTRWWEYFDDPVLTELIETALRARTRIFALRPRG